MKIHIMTFGCSANQNDSEIMAGLLENAGHDIVKDIKKSEVILINTCIVKGPAESKAKTLIKKMNLRFPDKKLVIAGCMPAAELKLLGEIAPDASFLSPQNIGRIVEIAERKSETVEFVKKGHTPKLNLPRIRKNKIISITQIAEGCTGNCSYCIVKLAKGSLFSYPSDEIVKDIGLAVKERCREIWITSQDNGAYGLDFGSNLVQLLDKILKVKGDFYIRIGMMNPNHIMPMLEEMVKLYKNPKIFKFLHIPVQSGNNEILKKMQRNYEVEDFKRIIRRFRKEMPEITIGTDIICGFPSETEKQFRDSYNLVKEIHPDVLNMSKFWLRPGTKAAEMEDHIDGKKIKERSKKLAGLFHKISLAQNEKWIEWKGKMLVDEAVRDGFAGRNYAYKQIIVKTSRNLFGKEINVKIKGAGLHCLIGEIV